MEQRSWETDNGDKRSKVEVVADEVGPSLRWATAEVRKIERSDAAVLGRRRQPAERQQQPSRVANQAPDDSDEEPF